MNENAKHFEDLKPVFVIISHGGYFHRMGAGGTPRWTRDIKEAFCGSFASCATEVAVRSLRAYGAEIIEKRRPS